MSYQSLKCICDHCCFLRCMKTLGDKNDQLALAREALSEVCAYAILHRPECLHPTTDKCICGALKAYMKACDVLENKAKLSETK